MQKKQIKNKISTFTKKLIEILKKNAHSYFSFNNMMALCNEFISHTAIV